MLVQARLFLRSVHGPGVFLNTMPTRPEGVFTQFTQFDRQAKTGFYEIRHFQQISNFASPSFHSSLRFCQQ